MMWSDPIGMNRWWHSGRVDHVRQGWMMVGRGGGRHQWFASGNQGGGSARGWGGGGGDCRWELTPMVTVRLLWAMEGNWRWWCALEVLWGDVGVGGEELKKWMRFPYSLSPIPIHVPFELVVEVSNGGAYAIFFLRNHCTPHPCLVARYPFHSTPRTAGKK